MLENLRVFLESYNSEIIMILAALMILVFILLIIQSTRLSSIKNKYNKMFKGTNVNNIEEMLIYNKNMIGRIDRDNREIQQAIRQKK